VVTCIADVVVCGSYMQYWFPEMSAWMPALSTLGILFLFNLLSVKMFGEAEFWFALIKVITIIALIVTGAWMVATGWTSPDGVKASLSHHHRPDGVYAARRHRLLCRFPDSDLLLYRN
jgi:AAT family amino acid transporter